MKIDESGVSLVKAVALEEGDDQGEPINRSYGRTATGNTYFDKKGRDLDR